MFKKKRVKQSEKEEDFQDWRRRKQRNLVSFPFMAYQPLYVI